MALNERTKILQSIHEAGPDFEELSRLSKELLSSILPHVASLRIESKIPAQQNICNLPSPASRVFVVRDGLLKYERADKLIFMYEEGDLVGVEKLFFAQDARVYSEFVTIVDEYDGQAFLAKIANDPVICEIWQKYLVAQTCIVTSILSCALGKESASVPQVRVYRAGDTILAEGSPGQEVCVLLDGKAEAWLHGKQVGEILREEIFGTMAVLTGMPRTATVKASSNCTVMIMPGDQFQDLIQTRPQAAWKLLQSMARIIVDLNQRVVK